MGTPREGPWGGGAGGVRGPQEPQEQAAARAGVWAGHLGKAAEKGTFTRAGASVRGAPGAAGAGGTASGSERRYETALDPVGKGAAASDPCGG